MTPAEPCRPFCRLLLPLLLWPPPALPLLLQEVQRNLEPKNRDKFTQNLTIVRHEFKSKV